MIIPSCSLRSKYIKTIPIGSLIEDPKNHNIYKVVEKRLPNSSSFVKVAVNHINQSPDDPIPIKLENVPEECFKCDNVKKANINQTRDSIEELVKPELIDKFNEVTISPLWRYNFLLNLH